MHIDSLARMLLFVTATAGLAKAEPAAPPASSRSGAQAGFYRTRVGSIDVTVVSDGTLPLDVAHGLVLGAKPGEVDRLLARSFQKSPIDASFNEFVLAMDGHVVLIDTGSSGNMGPTAGKLPLSLSHAGVRADAITDVFLTHIHPDHAGGLVAGGKRAFPNATIHVDAKELAYWMDASRSAKATGMAAMFFTTARAALEPYVAAGRVSTFTGSTELLPGFRAEAAYGHTPGHVAYVLQSGGQKLWFVGDLIHIPAVQLDDPSVAVAFDVDPAMAIETRKRLLGELADKGDLVAHDHVSFPGIGHIRRDGGAYRWVAAPYVNDAPAK